MKATSTDELHQIVDSELDFRFECGYNKPTSKIELSDKDALVKSIWLHFVLFVPHMEIQQLRKGLRETLQVELLMCLHPEEMHSFLVSSRNFDVTSAFFLDSFNIYYSEQGNNKRTLEESVMLNWTDYVMECDGMFHNLLYSSIIIGD